MTYTVKIKLPKMNFISDWRKLTNKYSGKLTKKIMLDAKKAIERNRFNLGNRLHPTFLQLWQSRNRTMVNRMHPAFVSSKSSGKPVGSI